MRARLEDCQLARIDLTIRRVEYNLGCKYSIASEASADAPEDKPIGKQTHANEHHYLPGH